MGDRKMLIVLLVSCVSLVLSQNDVEIRRFQELRKRSIQDAVSKFKAVIEEYSNKKIPDIEGKDGSFSYKISEIDISKVRVDLDPEISLFDGLKRANLTFKLPTFTVKAKWWGRYKTWIISITRQGSITATVNKASVTVVGSIDPEKVQDCSSKVDMSLKISGGGWILRNFLFFFKGPLVRKMEDKVEESICKAIIKHL